MNIKTIRDTNGNIILKTYIPPTIEVEELEDEGILAGTNISGETDEGSNNGEGDNDPALSKQGGYFFGFDTNDDSDF